ncbi:MAG: (Fe-S)-binding protein [Alphaproteobacteria bacterium]|nr:(Fe-S)-binding protein [Alphaproteobacteria bacterium]
MTENSSTNGKRIGLFATCLVNTMRPRVGFASLKLLEDAGFEVSVPGDQTCCGQPNYNSGDRESARDFARSFIDQFKDFDYVVVPSGSCAAMAKVHYPRLFDDTDPEKADIDAIAARTFELVSFLTDVAGLTSIEGKNATTVTYHDACSGLRELKIKQQPRTLLSSIDGLEIKEMEDAEVCCGFGGLFCVKYPDVSGEMVRKKSDEILKTDADAIVTGDVGCLLNMEGALARRGERTRAFHVAEVLAGLDKEDAS